MVAGLPENVSNCLAARLLCRIPPSRIKVAESDVDVEEITTKNVSCPQITPSQFTVPSVLDFLPLTLGLFIPLRQSRSVVTVSMDSSTAIELKNSAHGPSHCIRPLCAIVRSVNTPFWVTLRVIEVLKTDCASCKKQRRQELSSPQHAVFRTTISDRSRAVGRFLSTVRVNVRARSACVQRSSNKSQNRGGTDMRSIFYVIGVVVVVIFIARYFGVA